MTKVHSFRVYDANTDDYVYPPRKSTEERIVRIRGEILPGTEQDVPDDQLDGDGKHIGPPQRTGCQTRVES